MSIYDSFHRMRVGVASTTTPKRRQAFAATIVATAHSYLRPQLSLLSARPTNYAETLGEFRDGRRTVIINGSSRNLEAQ